MSHKTGLSRLLVKLKYTIIHYGHQFEYQSDCPAILARSDELT